ncbi:MAG: N-acetyl-gamma-glutamyl-phosphate reductase [Pseudomonadota bacterium]
MTHSIFIDGGAGTTGLEIADRLKDRPEFTLIQLDDDRRKDPEARREAINDSDFTILCLPDDAAREAVAWVGNNRTRIIDASSAHRTAEGWTYGFAEFREGQRERIAESGRVSNPGCYPTGFLGLVAPLVARGVLPNDWPYAVNAVSGYSGGGKALIGRFADEADIGFRSYGLTLDHKHMPEMRHHADLKHDVIFAPAVIRAYRGMIVEVPLHLEAMELDVRADELRSALQDHYAGSPLVQVQADQDMSELLVQEGEAASDRLDLFVCGNADGSQVRLIAKLDNLGKGAGGSTVQDLNIMAGIEEIAGLRL